MPRTGALLAGLAREERCLQAEVLRAGRVRRGRGRSAERTHTQRTRDAMADSGYPHCTAAARETE